MTRDLRDTYHRVIGLPVLAHQIDGLEAWRRLYGPPDIDNVQDDSGVQGDLFDDANSDLHEDEAREGGDGE